MKIPMLHTLSATGLVSSLNGESSATAQTVMHTNEAPKHVPRANVKSSQYTYMYTYCYSHGYRVYYEGVDTCFSSEEPDQGPPLTINFMVLWVA